MKLVSFSYLAARLVTTVFCLTLRNFRESEAVIVSPSGSLLRFKSSILEFSLLDSSLHLEDRPVPLESLRRTVRNMQQPGGGGGGEEEPGSPAAAPPQGDQMVLVVSTERGAACHALPSQKLTHNYTVPVSTKMKLQNPLENISTKPLVKHVKR